MRNQKWKNQKMRNYMKNEKSMNKIKNQNMSWKIKKWENNMIKENGKIKNRKEKI